MTLQFVSEPSGADPAITGAIADFAPSVSFAGLPAQVQRESVRDAGNWVGCTLGGAPTSTVATAIKGLQSYSSPGRCRDRTRRALRCARRRADQLSRLGGACL
jgi:hypothetical protein